jgi:hypothetical protein
VARRDGRLTWQAAGPCHVYHADTPDGPFTRLTADPVTDGYPVPAGGVCQVRAVALTETPSGSYWNAGQGAFSASP